MWYAFRWWILGLAVAAAAVLAGGILWLIAHVRVSPGSSSGYAALAALGGTAFGAYYWSLVRHPWRPCHRCKGTGGHVDTATPWKGTFGSCTCCSGTKKHLRWGVRVLRGGKPGKYG